MIDNLFGVSKESLPKNIARIRTRESEELVRKFVFNAELGSSISSNAIHTGAVFIKGDKNTSILNVNISKDSRAVNLTGYTVTANVKEGSKKIVTVACAILDESAGLIQINLPNTLVDEQGTNIFEIVLQKDSKVIVSQQYRYEVLNSLGEGTAGEETELSALQTLIQQVQESKNTVDTITTELEITQSDIDEIMSMIGGL